MFSPNLTIIVNSATLEHSQHTGDFMNEKVELYCTQNEEGQWVVWFPHPLTKIHILESFDNEDDARAFHTQQLSDAEYSE